MTNLFTRNNIDGLIIAACFHREAKKRKEGIHIAFFRRNADSMLLDLMAYIGIAESVKAHLPASRRVILHDAPLSQGIAETTERFLALHPDIEVVAINAIPMPRHRVFFWRIIAACLRPFLGYEDTIFFLTDHMK